MARMPGVEYLGIHNNGTMTAWDIVCVHTIVGYQAGGNAAHFTTNSDGRIIQARDTTARSAANLNGNWHVIAIENADMPPTWNTNDGHAVPAFTGPQIEAIAQILVWCHHAHGIPLQLVPDSKVGRRGIAYHRQGIDGNYSGYAYPGRVPGGELWSSSVGKVCPGDLRITQLIHDIIPRAKVLAGQQEDNMATAAEVWGLPLTRYLYANSPDKRPTAPASELLSYANSASWIAVEGITRVENALVAIRATQAAILANQQDDVDDVDVLARLDETIGAEMTAWRVEAAAQMDRWREEADAARAADREAFRLFVQDAVPTDEELRAALLAALDEWWNSEVAQPAE